MILNFNSMGLYHCLEVVSISNQAGRFYVILKNQIASTGKPPFFKGSRSLDYSSLDLLKPPNL